MVTHRGHRIALFLALWLLAPNTAQAQCQSAEDCDGDGLKNEEDPCPGIKNSGGDYRKGFQDRECYAPLIEYNFPQQGAFLDFNAGCIPVAARRIKTNTPIDILNPSPDQVESHTGFVIVGIRSYIDAITLATLGPGGPASEQQVLDGIKQGSLPDDALFACLASFEFKNNALANPQVIFGHKVATSYVRAITTAMPDDGYKHDAVGLFLDVRVKKPDFPDSIVGTHGTFWLSGYGYYSSLDATNHPQPTAVGPAVLSIKDSSLPQPITNLYDANCYAQVEKNIEKFLGNISDKTNGKYVKDPAYDIFDPGGPIEYSHVDQGMPLTKQEYLASVEGDLAALRKTPFGFKPVETKAFDIGSKLAPKPPKINKGGVPKFGADQYLQKAAVDYHDWNASVEIFEGATACGLNVQLESAQRDLSVCKCGTTDALIYYNDKQPPPLFYAPEQKQRTWSEVFQDGTPAPRTAHRAIEYFTQEFNGDFLSKAIGLNLNTPGISQNLLSPLLPTWWLVPGLQFWTKPSPKAKPKYQAGLLAQLSPKTGSWVLATGTWYSALQAHGLLTVPLTLERTWTWTEGNRIGIGATRKINNNFIYTSIPQALQQVPPGALDYFEVTMDASSFSDINPYDFAKDTSGAVVASAHLGANKWHPDGDLWVSNWSNQDTLNTAQRVAPSLGGFAASALANEFAHEWATFQSSYKVSEIDNFEARNAVCNIDVYDPLDPSHHWPRVDSNEPIAFLWGRPDTAATRFAADLIDAPIKPGTARLHEGMDINWNIKRFRDVDPAYHRIFGQIPPQYCYGTFPIEAAQINIALPCTSDVFNYCGSDADTKAGCSPWKRAYEEFLQDCKVEDCWEQAKDACSIFAPVCSIGTCAYGLVECAVQGADLVLDTVFSYGGGALCVAWSNKPCKEEQLTVFRSLYPEQEMDMELEHRFTYRASRYKIDPDLMCPESYEGSVPTPGQCVFDDFPQYNAIFETQSYTSSVFYTSWKFHNLHLKLGEKFEPIGSISWNPLEQAYPFSLAPGLVGNIFAPYARVATVWGPGHKTFDPQTQSIRLLPEGIAEKKFKKNDGFRVEFIGDTVIDCGHMPVKPEIHPPTNLLLHLGDDGGKMRYSLLGIRRKDQPGPAVFDLWPGPRQPGTTKLVSKIIFPDETSAEPPFLDCKPYPELAPNRIRCRVINDSALYDSLCDKNPYFLPSCAEGIGGGLVEVGWE